MQWEDYEDDAGNPARGYRYRVREPCRHRPADTYDLWASGVPVIKDLTSHEAAVRWAYVVSGAYRDVIVYLYYSNGAYPAGMRPVPLAAFRAGSQLPPGQPPLRVTPPVPFQHRSELEDAVLAGMEAALLAGAR